jgi:hypothetical protein
MNNKKLCKWLRDNSSGVYRPAAVAAERIESLERADELLRKLRDDLLERATMRRDFDGPDGDIIIDCGWSNWAAVNDYLESA